MLSVVADVGETSTREWSERTVMQDADLGGFEELRNGLDVFTY